MLAWNGALWRFHLLHLTIDEERRVAGGRHLVAEHAHLLYHLVLYTSGDNEATVGGAPVPFRRGTLILVAPNEPHDFSPRKQGRAHYDEITFAFQGEKGASLALPFHQMLSLWSGVPLAGQRSLDLTENQIARFTALLEEVRSRQGTGGPRAPLGGLEPVIALLAYVVTLLLDEGASAFAPDAVESARRHLEARLSETVRIRELAELTGRSGEALIRSFRKVHGLSPIAWQHARRIDSAAILLTSTHLPCAEIADRLGYTDVHHFSRMFRKIRGVPPTALRRARG